MASRFAAGKPWSCRLNVALSVTGIPILLAFRLYRLFHDARFGRDESRPYEGGHITHCKSPYGNEISQNMVSSWSLPLTIGANVTRLYRTAASPAREMSPASRTVPIAAFG